MHTLGKLLTLTLVCLTLGTLAWAQPDLGGTNTGGGKKGQQFTAENAVKLDGAVKAIVQPTATQRVQDVLLTLTTATETVEVHLAPAVFLKKIDLALKEGDTVTVNGWKEATHKTSFVIAGDLTVNGKTYVFRTPKGAQVWNAVLSYEVTTLTGKITAINTPALEKGKAKRQLVTFSLVTDKNTVPVELDTTAALAQLGFDAKEGDQVTILGWLKPAGKGKTGTLITRTITLGDKTFIVRDEDGNAAAKPAHTGKN